jgi:predicted metal-dependent phosphoesterase TrpH
MHVAMARGRGTGVYEAAPPAVIVGRAPSPPRGRDELLRIADDAERQIRRAERLPRWEPTPYEEHVLPGIKLLDCARPETAVLQNAADLHLHSDWSDGDLLDRVLAKAVEERLDVIAVTDHDEIGGALEARRRAHDRRLPLAVVPATEISTVDGHVGALFVQQAIPKGLSAAATVRLIHEAGGLAVAHHPFAPRLLEKALGVKLGVRDLVHQLPFDAVEATNAVPGFGRRYNREAWEAMRRKRRPVALTGGSDAHRARLIGKGRTYFAGNFGVRSLKDALEQGAVLAGESYWTWRELLSYRFGLARGVVRAIFGGRSKRR